MLQPKRVQRKRVKGYRMPENTISVARPGKWGNPFSVALIADRLRRELGTESMVDLDAIDTAARAEAIGKFRDMMLDVYSHKVDAETRQRFRYMRDRIKDLRDKNLACFCHLDLPCHADVLLELANLSEQ